MELRVSGPVLRPGDGSYERHCAGFQLGSPHRPELVVCASDERDARETVRYAAARGLRVGVQATGHGRASPLSGGVLVHTGAMRGARVDPAARTAWVRAGTPWSAVVGAAAEYGLAPLSGSFPGVGAVGYTLGGGLGLLGRQHGWAADHVRRIELVTPDGELVEVTAEREPELFWALRGGGYGFGVVTGMEIELFAVRSLHGGGLYFTGPRVPDVVCAWREWAQALPEQVTSSVGVLPYPDMDGVPEPLRGRYAAHVRIAATVPVDELVGPLRAFGPVLDSLGELPYTDSGSIHHEPSTPHAYLGDNAMLTDLDDAALRRVLELTGPQAGAMHVLQCYRLGGALSRQPETPNAICHRRARYAVGVLSPGEPGDPAPAAAVHGAVTGALEPWRLGRNPNYTFGSDPGGPRAGLHDAATGDRLAALRARHDPAGLFAVDTGEVVRSG